MDKKIKLKKLNPEKTIKQISEFIINEITKINYTGGVIGLSGGVDSTVTAALTKKAFDIYNSTHSDQLELIAYLLPSDINNPNDLIDGKRVAERLEIKYEIVDIQPIVESYKKIDQETFENPFQKGNLMSEIRALILHRKSALGKKLVIGTGNHDEDVGVGYYTLFGDGAVHLSPIAGLSKRLVKELSVFFGFSNIASKSPSAGLEPNQTDFKDLGYSYDFVELISEAKNQGFTFEELIESSQVKEMFEKDKQKYQKLCGESKFQDLISALKSFEIRQRIAKSKARIVLPPSPELNLEYEEN